MQQRLRILLAALSAEPMPGILGVNPWTYTVCQFLVIVLADGMLAVGIWLAWSLMWAMGGLLTGDLSSRMLGFLPTILQLMFLSFTFTAHVVDMGDARDTATALLRAVAARDPVIAPAAQADASTTTKDERGFSVALPETPVTVAVPALLTVARFASAAMLVTGALVALMAVGMVAAIPLGLNIPLSSVFTDPSAIVLLAMAACFATISLLPFAAGWRWRRRRARQRQGLAVTLSASGLAFRRPETPRRERIIAWRDVRSLARIAYKDTQTHERIIYLLDTEAEVLLWEEPPTERYVPAAQAQETAERQASAQRLVALIAARTGLPLLDLSTMVTTLTQQTVGRTSLAIFNSAYVDAIASGDSASAQLLWQALDAQTQRRLSMLRWSPEARLSERAQATLARRAAQLSALTPKTAQLRREWARLALALLPYYPQPADAINATPERQRSLRLEQRRQTLTRLLTRFQVAVLLATLLAGAGLWLDNTYTNHVVHDLPQRVRQESPLYETSFRYPEDDWPMHTPTRTDTSTQAYVNGAYQITDSNSANSIMADTASINMRDGAEQVTVTELGKADENNLAWVGLALDVNADGTKFTTFMVDELGDWSLSHYDGSLPADQQWSTPDGGQSDAVRQGAGATNTLLLIRRGDLYLLYVNDTLVDAYADHDHALTPGGYVGVYLDEGGYIARFRDFAVYPAPTALPFWMR